MDYWWSQSAKRDTLVKSMFISYVSCMRGKDIDIDVDILRSISSDKSFYSWEGNVLSLIALFLNTLVKFTFHGSL